MDTWFDLYNICKMVGELSSFVFFLFTGDLIVLFTWWESCSQFFKVMWLEELSENTQHLSMFIASLEEEILDINVRLNQAVRQ